VFSFSVLHATAAVAELAKVRASARVSPVVPEPAPPAHLVIDAPAEVPAVSALAPIFSRGKRPREREGCLFFGD